MPVITFSDKIQMWFGGKSVTYFISISLVSYCADLHTVCTVSNIQHPSYVEFLFSWYDK